VRSTCLLASLLLLTAACHRPRIPEGGKLRVSLQRVPRHQHASALPECAAMGEVTVIDHRGTADLGEQLLEYAKPGQTVPVVSVNDPCPWFSDVARSVGSDSMVRFGRGWANLELSLRRLTAFETFTGTFGANYRSQVVFDAKLTDKNGRAIFTGTFDADFDNYGADQSMENMLETVNHAAEKALVRLYDDPAFRSALCGGVPGARPAPL